MGQEAVTGRRAKDMKEKFREGVVGVEETKSGTIMSLTELVIRKVELS